MGLGVKEAEDRGFNVRAEHGGKLRRRRSTTPQAQFMTEQGKSNRVFRPIIQKIQETVQVPLPPFGRRCGGRARCDA